ncbi:hypothetical protein Bca52824_053946 [Brassica carinata]|uniref:Uncharacterized protein n=1 Tax=Brassica carinata TaxID=52824 RepID=A0A8X7UNP2_BRACI|nr:hypothetical protein Bca52824_053946 [Brassica carinata]
MALALPLLYIPDDADYEFMTHGGQTSGEVGQRTVESSPTPRRLKQKKFSFLLQSFPNLKTLVWEKTVSLIIKELLPSADKYCYKLPDQRYE